jgi:hypothetical protein
VTRDERELLFLAGLEHLDSQKFESLTKCFAALHQASEAGDITFLSSFSSMLLDSLDLLNDETDLKKILYSYLVENHPTSNEARSSKT